MNPVHFLRRSEHKNTSLRLFVLALSTVLLLHPIGMIGLAAQQRGQKRRPVPAAKRQLSGEMSDDQKVSQALTRLSFGARPGDFDRVRAMGVNAYIEQQLLPDTLDETALESRLAKLPTLALTTPTLIEVYNPPPPKPVPTASPTPAPALPSTLPAQKPSASGTAVAQIVAPGSASSVVEAKQPASAPATVPATVTAGGPSGKATGTATSDAQKPATEGEKKLSADPPKPAPAKPPPPPRNPQMVVTELQRATFLRAAYSEKQLNEVMVAFWENHFSIFVQKDVDRFMLTSFDRDVIRPFAMDRFRDLLGAVAHSPAMLYYLDNWQSSLLRRYPAANGKPARQTGGINENYARELMELHTLGVDGGYTQHDVQEVARCLTGWSIRKPNQEGLFLYNPAMHDNGEKVVLGHKIPAGGGINDGERVLDILAAHPSTARFIATKLARRFISDDPPASVVNRAAEVFIKTGGSIRETLRSVITSPEFFSTAAYRAKVRSPFEFAVAAVRATNAETDGDRPILDWIARMGQPIFGRLTPDGYADRADNWLSTGALLHRLNFANALSTNKIKGTVIKADYLSKIGGSGDFGSDFVQSAIGGDVSRGTRGALNALTNASNRSDTAPAPTPVQALLPAVSVTLTADKIGFTPGSSLPRPPAAAATAPTAVPPYMGQVMTLVIGSPEFQRR